MPRKTSEEAHALEERFQAAYAALPATAPVACTDERREYVRALNALRDIVLALVRACGNARVGRCAQWVMLKEKCKVVEHKPCCVPACKGGVLLLMDFANNRHAHDGKHCVCKTCQKRENIAAAKKACRERANAAAAALAMAPEVADSGAVEDRLADAMCAAAPGDFFKMPEFRRTDVLADAGDGSELLIKVQIKASESQSKGGQFSNCFGYGAGEDSAANAAHRMIIVLGWKPPGDGAAYVLWVLDGARVPSDEMCANAATHRLCIRTLNMAPNATLATLPDAVRRVAAKIAADGGSARSTRRDAFFDIKRASHRTEVAGMLAFEAAGLGAVTFPTAFQGVVDVHLDGVPTQAKTAGTAGTASMSHRYKGGAHKPYHADDAIEQVLIHTLYKSGADLWLMHALVPKRKLVKEGIFCRDEGGTKDEDGDVVQRKQRQGGQTTLTLPLSRWSPWLAGRACTGISSG
eukprot:4711439-Prymnesium_polylepis.1